MNKTIMWLIIGVIVAAMGVLLGSQYFNMGGAGNSGGSAEIIMRPSPRPEFSLNAPPQMPPQTRMPGEPFSPLSSSTPPPPAVAAAPAQEPPRASAEGRASGSLAGESKGQSSVKVESESAAVEERGAFAPPLHSAPVLTPVPVKSLVEPDTEILPEPVQPVQPDRSSAVKPAPASPAASKPATAPAKPATAATSTTAAPAGGKPAAAESKPASKPAATASKPAATESKPAPAKPAATPAPAKASGEKTVKGQAQAADGGFVLRLSGSEAMRYQSILLSGPDRLVVDLPGKWEVKVPGVPKNSIATKVRVGRQPDKTRIVIDLSAVPASHRILAVNPNTLEIRIKGK